MPLFESLERRAAKIVAEQSDNESILAELATAHPDADIRGKAVANPSLPPHVLPAVALNDVNPFVRAGALRHHACPRSILFEAAANDQSQTVRLEILSRDDATADLIETLVASLLTKMTSNSNHSQRTNWAQLSVVQSSVVHQHCPEKFVESLLDQIAHAGADTRESAAEVAHQARPTRRDAIHTRLLQSSRKGKTASRIVEAIVCPKGEYDAERAQWLQTHPDLGVRHLAELYVSAHEPAQLADIIEKVMTDVEVALSPEAESEGDMATSLRFAVKNVVHEDREGTDAGQDAVVLDDVALAVRVRRLWITNIVPWLIELDHDFSYGWSQTTLIRRGLILDLVTPINFGIGDPFADGVGEELSRRLAGATAGRINQVSWKFRGDRPKPVRRKGSTDRDIFHAGDPNAEACADAALELSKRLKSLSADAQTAVQALGVAAVSQHRVWLVAPDQARFLAIGTTPGARFAVHDAVRLWQKQKDPLFTIYVDHYVSCNSPQLG